MTVGYCRQLILETAMLFGRAASFFDERLAVNVRNIGVISVECECAW